MGQKVIIEELSAAELVSYCSLTEYPAAWQEFVKRYHNRIIQFVLSEQYAHRLPNTVELTQDLAQEFYVRLLANGRSALREFRGNTEASLLAYLCSVVHSVVADHVRREGRKKRAVPLVSIDEPISRGDFTISLADILAAGEESSPEQMFNERITPKQLRTLLSATLKGSNARRDALIFQLHVLDSLMAREIAELPAFNITVDNVMVIIRRTRERLREALADPNTAKLLL